MKFTFFGSSHSDKIGATIYGLPVGYAIDVEQIERELYLRRVGVGRSVRQILEKDKVVLTGGLVAGRTDGKPFRFYVANVDSDLTHKPPITAVRSGHADLVGCVKYGLTDARQIAEYAGGRSTLPHTVIGSVCRQILRCKFGIQTYAYVMQVGNLVAPKPSNFSSILDAQDNGEANLLCCDDVFAKQVNSLIEQYRQDGNTLGGRVGVGCVGLDVGVGDFHDYFDKLDSMISAYLMAIPSVKGIEFGLGREYEHLGGLSCVDKLQLVDDKIVYKTNNCGGIVGGMSNGMPLQFSLTVKPVPTTRTPVVTYDMVTHQQVMSHYERSDVCVVANIGVIARNMLATVILRQYIKEGRI